MLTTIQQMIERRVPGRALPREFYLDESVCRLDLERVFFANWLFAGHTCEIPEAGDYFVFKIADESVIVIRDEAGEVRAHFNVCRHRGSNLCTEPAGRVRKLVCPYHQWTYRLDGTLAKARWMGDDFDPSAYGLHPVHVRVLSGLIYLCLAQVPPEFEDARQAITPQLGPHGLERAKVCYRKEYWIKANWKVVFENNRECYHCRSGHPEFCLSNFDVGVNGDRRADAEFAALRERETRRWQALGLAPREVSFPNGTWYRVCRFPLKEGFLTESLDGRTVAPLLGDIPEPRTGSLRIVTLPNAWVHANCDYAVSTRLAPFGPKLTHAQVCFLVRRNAVEGVDYDPERVAAVWKATSEQDWALCENNQAGINSSRYQPGPYSPLAENGVEAFVQWYLAQLQSAGQALSCAGSKSPSGEVL
jgi:Rieske 2Fe-2S family protein